MNNLSLILYCAGVVGSLQPLFALTGIFGFIGVMGIKVFRFAEDLEPMALKGYFIGFGLLVVLACLLPSERTVYMIAASEVSGRAVASPQGQQVLDLLTQKIIAGLGK